MDNTEDFVFLVEEVAKRYNPFLEGEYLIVQIYPRRIGLSCRDRTFDFVEAQNICSRVNLSHDYSHFSIRMFHEGQLWDVDELGQASKVSLHQNWQIHGDYLEVPQLQPPDNEADTSYLEAPQKVIIVCACSYPYISEVRFGDTNYWETTTCLVEDSDRPIERCPNCNTRLFDWRLVEDEEDEFMPIPLACIACSNYHGEKYNGNLLVCAMHPHGWNDGDCPDYSYQKPEIEMIGQSWNCGTLGLQTITLKDFPILGIPNINA